MMGSNTIIFIIYVFQHDKRAVWCDRVVFVVERRVHVHMYEDEFHPRGEKCRFSMNPVREKLTAINGHDLLL